MEKNVHKQGFYEKYVKRVLDIVCSGIALVVLSPVFIVVAILVRINMGSPVLFKQERPGLNEEIFGMYKFRSMNEKRDEEGNLLPDMQRITKFGHFIRNTSLDELPELFNIFKGDMSIIGPRPLLVKYLPRYNEIQRHRHDVRPGLTGLAQANGRNASTWEERFEYDIQYVENITFLGDVKIILDTIKTVLKKEGIDSQMTMQFTMLEFCGTKEDEK